MEEYSFFLIVYICAKDKHKHGEIVENKGFPVLVYPKVQANTKTIMTYVTCIASHKRYIIHQYRFGIRMCSILARCWKSSEMGKIAYFNLIYQNSGQINAY